MPAAPLALYPTEGQFQQHLKKLETLTQCLRTAVETGAVTWPVKLFLIKVGDSPSAQLSEGWQGTKVF